MIFNWIIRIVNFVRTSIIYFLVGAVIVYLLMIVYVVTAPFYTPEWRTFALKFIPWVGYYSVEHPIYTIVIGLVFSLVAVSFIFLYWYHVTYILPFAAFAELQAKQSNELQAKQSKDRKDRNEKRKGG